MGLDMWIMGRIFLYNDEDKNSFRTLLKEQNITLDYEVYYIEIELAYWRKAFIIKSYFDNYNFNEDDKLKLTMEDIKILLNKINNVLKDHKLLNVEFDYDEWDSFVEEELIKTKQMLEKILLINKSEISLDMYYRYSM
jgi:hypothetical protein